MATNWSGYEAAKEILEGNNIENIAEIGSRFPLFARTVAFSGSEQLLDILKALPKVTARVIETGLKDIEDTEEETEAPKASTGKKKTVSEETDDFEEEEDTETTYESMTGKDLYALCCKRGISSLCKSRKKEDLIDLLEKLDNGEIEPSKGKAKAEPKKATAKKPAKKAEPVEEDEEDWEDEEEEDTDPYAGKSAMELFKMCQKRGIKTKPKQKADAYVKLLKKADEAEAEEEDTEDDEDEWEI